MNEFYNARFSIYQKHLGKGCHDPFYFILHKVYSSLDTY